MFKENCSDLRNSRVFDTVRELQTYGLELDVYDPWVDLAAAEQEYGIIPLSQLQPHYWDGINRQFREMGTTGIRQLLKEPGVLYDVKWVLPKEAVDGRL